MLEIYFCYLYGFRKSASALLRCPLSSPVLSASLCCHHTHLLLLLPKSGHSSIISPALIHNWPQTQDTQEKLIKKKKKRIKDVWPQEKGLKETPTWVKPRSVAEHRQQHEQLILMPESAIPEHHLVFCASLLATTLVVIRQS